MERQRLETVLPLQSIWNNEGRKRLPAPSPLVQFIRPSKALGAPSVAQLLVLRSLHALATGR
jgi:hypothetical protein